MSSNLAGVIYCSIVAMLALLLIAYDVGYHRGLHDARSETADDDAHSRKPK